MKNINEYSAEQFNTNFRIGRSIYKLLFHFIYKSEYSNYILILFDQDRSENLIITGFDMEKRAIVPIPSRSISEVVDLIKKIPFKKEYEKIIATINFKSARISTAEKLLSISDNIKILCANYIPLERADINDIKIELMPDIYIRPNEFVLGAFDGLDSYIYFNFLESDVPEIKLWGALSEVRVYMNDTIQGEYLAQKTKLLSGGYISFLGQAKIAAILEARRAGNTSISNIDIREFIDLIVSSAGIYNSVSFPDEYMNKMTWYTVVIPLEGVSFCSGIGLGNVEFCNENHDIINRARNFDKQFEKYTSYAFVHVNSSKLYDAYILGKKQIEQAIDLLLNVVRDDSIYCLHSFGSQKLEWEANNIELRVSLSTLSYIEVPITNGQLSYNFLEYRNIKELSISNESVSYQNELEKVELLLLKANGNNDKDISPLFNSLKWIRKAWESDNYEDRLIYAIISLEFIVSKEKNTPMLNKPTRKACKKQLEQKIKELNPDSCTNPDYINKVLEKFDRTYTESPFMQKLKNLIDRLNIPVPEYEMNIIVSAREQRNGIIHGKNDIQLPTTEIYKLCEIISKIAFYKIMSLEI